MFDIYRYTADKQTEWDAYVARSKNGTFLFRRGYMEYHSDRFADCSLMFYLRGKLYALLPANVKGTTLFSHQGLTYGGLVMNEKCCAAEVLKLFEEMNEWLKNKGINKVVYKPIPYIYSTQPAEEDQYALFRCGAQVTARGISTCIDLTSPIKWRQNRRTALNKAMAEQVAVSISDDLETFWLILEENLMTAHGVKPVHSVAEMRLLKERFPDNIILYTAKKRQGKVIAGILLYRTPQVIHSQYISATEEGKATGAIDAIMQEIVGLNGKYFDFGISTEQDGHVLNESLIFQKEGFGGRGICYDTYEYSIS